MKHPYKKDVCVYYYMNRISDSHWLLIVSSWLGDDLSNVFASK